MSQEQPTPEWLKVQLMPGEWYRSSSKPILIDCDGVLADFVPTYLAVVERLFGRKHTYNEVTDWHFRKCITTPAEDRAVWAEIDRTCGLVERLPEREGTTQALGLLRQRGRVVCVTSPHSGPHWSFERELWLRAHGFHRDNIVMAHDKTLVVGAALIDDKLANVEAYAAAHPGAVTVLVDQPWNQGPTTALRAHSWDEIIWAVSAAVTKQENIW